jgi:hypothetical protein
MTNPYYNRLPFAPGTVVRAEAVNAEFEKIMQAFAKLPAPTAIPNGGGAPNYTHRAYSDSADGTANFTTGAAGTRSYIGFAVNQTSATPSTNPEDYEWSRLRGADGDDGNAGTDGTDGADGADGEDGGRTEYRFIRSLTPPGPAAGNIPSGTSLIIEDGTLPVWLTAAERDGGDNLVTGWSPWVRLSPYPNPELFDTSRTYYEGEQVLFGGGTYILVVASSTGIAPSGTNQPNGSWAVIAAPGEIGAPASPPSAFTATIDLTSSNIGVNLRSIADANGYTGQSDATITFRVPSGVTINGAPGAGSGGGAGIDTGTWPTGSYTIALTLVVQSGGIVNGGGGKGGDGGSGVAGSVGGKGGDGVFQRVNLSAITVDSGGTLRAGGGGGGGGTGNFISAFEPSGGAGGGGGGGAPNGAGGFAGSTFTSDTAATAGSAGTSSGGGAGGAGQNDTGGATGSAGGAGGTYATAGTASGAIGGGAAGYAVRRNGFTSTFTNNGVTTGTVG